jgi:hypothetical protein
MCHQVGVVKHDHRGVSRKNVLLTVCNFYKRLLVVLVSEREKLSGLEILSGGREYHLLENCL